MLFHRPAGESDSFFNLYPISGCITYWSERLYNNSNSTDLPSTVNEAEKIARSFFEESNRVVSEYRKVSGQPLPELFPNSLKVVGSQSVFSSADSETADHILIVFVPYLTTGGGQNMINFDTDAHDRDDEGIELSSIPSIPQLEQPEIVQEAPVYGGSIELRIGPSEEIVGLSSNWRPRYNLPIKSVDRVAPPVANENDDTNLPIIYYLEGKNEPQRFISPYYLLTGNDHHGDFRLYPASNHSMLGYIGSRPSADGIEVYANVIGHTANDSLEFAWGYWRLDLASTHVVSSHNSPTLQLPSGVYNVVLDVRDKLTGAIARTEEIIRSSS